MRDGDILIVKGHEVASLLVGQEREIVRIIRAAYLAHGQGASSLPHSTFLRFPEDQRNRIIALPAYLGQEFGVAGIKWVASFPGNLEQGLDRASAVTILNSRQTGRPEAIIEGSIISARRTAASAALAAEVLHDDERSDTVGMIGCGLINFEIARFLRAVFKGLKLLVVFDVDAGRALRFAEHCRNTLAGIEVEVASDSRAVLERASLVSVATTATSPHICDLSMCPPASTILHISLRDFSPEAILACENIVDDIDHVCRAQTSVHLAEQLVGSRDFITSTLADVLNGNSPRARDGAIAIFSPFGLGVLDIAVGKFVCELALKSGRGTKIESFLPEPWMELNGKPASSGK